MKNWLFLLLFLPLLAVGEDESDKGANDTSGDGETMLAGTYEGSLPTGGLAPPKAIRKCLGDSADTSVQVTIGEKSVTTVHLDEKIVGRCKLWFARTVPEGMKYTDYLRLVGEVNGMKPGWEKQSRRLRMPKGALFPISTDANFAQNLVKNNSALVLVETSTAVVVKVTQPKPRSVAIAKVAPPVPAVRVEGERSPTRGDGGYEKSAGFRVTEEVRTTDPVHTPAKPEVKPVESNGAAFSLGELPTADLKRLAQETGFDDTGPRQLVITRIEKYVGGGRPYVDVTSERVDVAKRGELFFILSHCTGESDPATDNRTSCRKFARVDDATMQKLQGVADQKLRLDSHSSVKTGKPPLEIALSMRKDQPRLFGTY